MESTLIMYLCWQEKSAQQASKDYKQQQKELPKEEEREPKKKEKETQWADTNEVVKYVIHGGKVQCQYCSPPMADIIVTSNTVMLQDKPFATVKDKDGKKNFNFTGVCNHPSQQKPMSPPPPCKSVIQLGEWKNYSETKINDDNALLVKSTIPCMISGEDLKIIDSGQKAELTQVKPKTKLIPKVTDVYWKEDGSATKLYIDDPEREVTLYIETEDFTPGDVVKIWFSPDKGNIFEDGSERQDVVGVATADGITVVKNFRMKKQIQK